MTSRKVFRVKFNRGKQWFDVFFHDVHPNTFSRRGGGRWAYFYPTWESPRVGLFGEVHIIQSRVRHDVVVHELDHLRTEWMLCKGIRLSRRNEEKMALFIDELVRHFWKAHDKWELNNQ